MNDNVKRISDWVNLVKGEHYYIEAVAIERTGNDHVTVGVEIEQTAITGHHNSMKEIQRLSINVTNNLDTTRLTIENADGKDYKLNFMNPKNLKYYSSELISTKATALQFRNGI